MFIECLRDGRALRLDEVIEELGGKLYDRLTLINSEQAAHLEVGEFVWKVNHQKEVAVCLEVKKTREHGDAVTVLHSLGESIITGEYSTLYHLLTPDEMLQLAA